MTYDPVSMADCSNVFKRSMITYLSSYSGNHCYHCRLMITFTEWTTPRHLYGRVHWFKSFVWRQSINSCKASIEISVPKVDSYLGDFVCEMLCSKSM